MPPIRYREYRDDTESSNGTLLFAAGAVAGLAAGVFITQRFGGFEGLVKVVRAGFSRISAEELEALELERRTAHGDAFLADDEFADEIDDVDDVDDLDDDDEDELLGDSPEEMLEERVLEAFHEDQLLAERAIDIGAIGEGVIELTGWVRADDEANRALTVARRVPGVERVVNHIVVRGDSRARRVNDPEGQSVSQESSGADGAPSSIRAD